MNINIYIYTEKKKHELGLDTISLYIIINSTAILRFSGYQLFENEINDSKQISLSGNKYTVEIRSNGVSICDNFTKANLFMSGDLILKYLHLDNLDAILHKIPKEVPLLDLNIVFDEINYYEFISSNYADTMKLHFCYLKSNSSMLEKLEFSVEESSLIFLDNTFKLDMAYEYNDDKLRLISLSLHSNSISIDLTPHINMVSMIIESYKKIIS